MIYPNIVHSPQSFFVSILILNGRISHSKCSKRQSRERKTKDGLKAASSLRRAAAALSQNRNDHRSFDADLSQDRLTFIDPRQCGFESVDLSTCNLYAQSPRSSLSIPSSRIRRRKGLCPRD